MQKINDTHSAAASTAPPMTAGQLNRLDDESASLVRLLHYPEPGAKFDRIIDACNELRYACLGTYASTAAGPTDECIGELWNFSTGGSFVPPDMDAFARAVWDAALRAQPTTDHLLVAGAEQESRYATMIGDISEALGLTETEQFEAEGADAILARIVALQAANVPHIVQGLVPLGIGVEVVDAEFPGTPNVAECIAQLDTWNGHLEAAIDREALEHLGQHQNDETAAGDRDPLEQLP